MNKVYSVNEIFHSWIVKGMFDSGYIKLGQIHFLFGYPQRFDPKLEPGLEPRLDPRLEPRLDSRLDPRLDTGLDPRLDTGLDPGLDC